MDMGRKQEESSAADEDKDFSLDREIQKTNAFQKDAGLRPIFTTPRWTQEQLKEYRILLRHNGELKVQPAFTGRDKILIHFNRVNPGEKPPAELLKAKYADHIATHKFGAKYAARHFIDRIIALSSSVVPNPSKKWVGPNRYFINDWILISTDEDSSESLEDIIGDTLTKEEAKWRLPHPYDQYASYIAHYNQGIHPQINTRSREHAGLPPLNDEERHTFGLDTGQNISGEQRRVKVEPKMRADYRGERKVIKEPKEPKPKLTPGVVSIADIAKKLGCTPGEARKVLRATKTPKPASGNWAWDKSESDKIEKIVKKGLK
jgi:hypothetical protein